MKQLIEEVKAANDGAVRVTVKGLAEKHGMSMPAVRTALLNQFGKDIMFKRGRYGGITLNITVE